MTAKLYRNANTALIAIDARIRGEYDDVQLRKIGPLGSLEDDINRILDATSARAFLPPTPNAGFPWDPDDTLISSRPTIFDKAPLPFALRRYGDDVTHAIRDRAKPWKRIGEIIERIFWTLILAVAGVAVHRFAFLLGGANAGWLVIATIVFFFALSHVAKFHDR